MEKPGEISQRREVKVYEMFLMGQVPAHRVEQVLDILAGMTASQPRRRIERHVIYRPDRPPPEKEVAKGGSQTIVQPKNQPVIHGSKDLSLTRLVKNLKEEDFGATQDTNDLWRQVNWELPTASQKEAILRAVMESSFQSKEPETYMELLKYKPITQLIFEGHQFVAGNIVLFLHRIRRFPETEFSGPSSALPELDKFPPVDPSNTTLLMASIDLIDSTSTELVTAALTELKSLKERLKGVVELLVPERLSFDTRVK